MKKSYITPTVLAITLTPMQMIAESMQIHSSSDPLDETNSITSGDQVLTKGSKSIWDSEW